MSTGRQTNGDTLISQFVGRRAALDAYFQCRVYRHMKNGVYYHAGGGVGKTWLLRLIATENGNSDDAIIDFFNTSNQNIRGIQHSIRERLDDPESALFAPYDSALEAVETARAEDHTDSGLIAMLEKRASRVFIECCQNAVQGHDITLLFDTFERVQQREVGRWLMTEFLPEVRDAIVVIAGRPPVPDSLMPTSVRILPLTGWERDETRLHVKRAFAPEYLSEITIDNIHNVTRGTPLLVNLVCELGDRDSITALVDNPEAHDFAWLRCQLARHFTIPTDENRAIWAMAFLRRRFTLDILRRIVERADLFDIQTDYATLLDTLTGRHFVKEYPDAQSHLLHDEMQALIEECLLEGVDPDYTLRGDLFNAIVSDYYNEQITAAVAASDDSLEWQLRAEQIGYIFERAVRIGELQQVLSHYLDYRRYITDAHTYDFEELLWGEISHSLSSLDDGGYSVYFERGEWLHQNNLYAKAAHHFRELLRLFPQQPVNTYKWLGYAYLRQGQLDLAAQTFQDGLDLVKTRNDIRETGEFHNLLAQVSFQEGQWERAFINYHHAANAYMLSGDQSGVASVYLNRGFMLALQGHYEEAIAQCRNAVRLLGELPEDDSLSRHRRQMYAHMNLGTAHRHAGLFDIADTEYTRCLQLAQQYDDHEVLCYVHQHMGINHCLRGAALRREGALEAAVERQNSAWDHLMKALAVASGQYSPLLLSHCLGRLARVYEEIRQLDRLMGNAPPALRQLKDRAANLHIAEEVQYQSDLLLPGDFAAMSWLEREARLAELSALSATEASEYLRALDSWMLLARLLLELLEFRLVPVVVRRVERIQSFDFLAGYFEAMAQIIHGHLEYETGNFDAALAKYGTYYAELARQTGYASYVLTDSLKDLEARIQRLPPSEALYWCDELGDSWLRGGVASVRPDMLRRLESLRADILRAGS